MADEPVIRMKLNKRDKTISVWYLGKELGGPTDVFDTIKNPEHAKLYMEEYRKLSPYADANVGYMTGYYGPRKMRALQERFGVGHPIFGKSVPTAKKAPKEGLKAGRRARKKD